MTLDYVHVDVFADRPLAGNGLAVVFCDGWPGGGLMLEIAREFKQFETVFVSGGADGADARARIFTVDGELPFAGHPTLGAAAALHRRYGESVGGVWLGTRRVPVATERTAWGFRARMGQGEPVFLPPVAEALADWLVAAHGLDAGRRDRSLPVQVVSTGLAYALVPVTGALGDARIVTGELGERLAGIGADFAYLFRAEGLEARTWDNLGRVEDSATGSAAGPLAAYLVRHGRLKAGERAVIQQGAWAGRPGTLVAWLDQGEAYVEGDVALFAEGALTI